MHVDEIVWHPVSGSARTGGQGRGKRKGGREKGEEGRRPRAARREAMHALLYSSVPVIQKLTVSAFMPIHWRAAAEVDMPSTLTQ